MLMLFARWKRYNRNKLSNILCDLRSLTKSINSRKRYYGGCIVKSEQKIDLLEFYRNFFNGKDNEELVLRLASHSRIIERKKGDIIFRPESDVSISTFLLDGVVKTYNLSPSGVENNLAFYYKPGTAICLSKEMINIPEIWGKTLTPSIMVDLCGLGPYELAEDYPDLYRVILEGYKPFYFIMLDKIRAISTLNAKERYLWFLDKYAPIADTIPQNEIAMYLGIKPQSLSRIRGELFQTNGVTPPPKNKSQYAQK